MNLNKAEDIYESLVNGESNLDSAVASDTLVSLREVVDNKKTELRGRSKTSQLWLNYQSMVRVSRSLIKADRTGFWQMHLRAVSDCLPIFAAAGHFSYLKSVHYYIQEMSQLPNRHRELSQRFEQGSHVIRRSNQLWAGLSSDLVIEQSLMRSLKTSGGLTRGTGMTEEQRSLWTMSTPITSQYNHAMQEFNELSYTTSEQHKEATQARVQRDSSGHHWLNIHLFLRIQP